MPSVAGDDAHDAATAAMPAMLRRLREVATLSDDYPRRVAALDEKRRVLALVEEARRRRG